MAVPWYKNGCQNSPHARVEMPNQILQVAVAWRADSDRSAAFCDMPARALPEFRGLGSRFGAVVAAETNK